MAAETAASRAATAAFAALTTDAGTIVAAGTRRTRLTSVAAVLASASLTPCAASRSRKCAVGQRRRRCHGHERNGAASPLAAVTGLSATAAAAATTARGASAGADVGATATAPPAPGPPLL